MITVEAPANFVLTLQSVPPFLVENILALALVALLAVPLIAHIQLLLDNTSKATTMGALTRRKYDCDHHRERVNRTVVMHYPVPVKLDSSSNSDLNIQLTSMRTTCSTPTVKRSVEKLKIKSNNENPDIHLEEQYKQILRQIFLNKQKTCLPLERSSSFLATNAELPIIDISAFDYDCYRHKLIEMSLKRQYGDRQAPGNVVLNSIHLNSVGSQSAIQLSEKYSQSLFDFIEEYYDATKMMSRKEKEYLHPLDHFLVKGFEKPKTANTGTETKESMTELDEVPDMIPFRDESPMPTAASLTPFGRRRIVEAAKHASKLTLRSRGSSSIPRTHSQTSLTATPSLAVSQKTPINPGQLFDRQEKVNSNGNAASIVPMDKQEERRRAFLTPRTSRSRTPRGAASATISTANKAPQGPKVTEAMSKRVTSVERGKSSSESFSPYGSKPGEYSEPLSTDHDEKESVTCASATSSEVASSYSSSKPLEKPFVRPRASSLSSRSRTIGTTSRTGLSYVSRNPNALVNQETPKKSPGKATKPKITARPRSTGGRFDWDVPDVPGHTWCEETTGRDKPTAVEVVERPKTANAISNRRRIPEKDKISETVLPVLESVIDLQVELPCNGFDRVDIEKEQVPRGDVKRFREFKRRARSSDKKGSSESFVKSPARSVVENKTSAEKRSNDRANAAEPVVVAKKSSSGIKTPASRPGSASRLPVHVGADRTRIKKIIEDTNRRDFAEKPENHLIKKSTGILSNTIRPRTTGYVRGRTSSLSPKMELSVEALRSNDGSPVVVGVSTKEPASSKQMESSKQALTNANQLKTLDTSPSSSGKRTTSVAKSSINKIPRSTDPRVSKNNTDSSKEDGQQVSSPKRQFLLARSGKYGAPKLDVVDKKPNDSTKQGEDDEKKRSEN